MSEPKVEVTQADRDAAADNYIQRRLLTSARCARDGSNDRDELVQDFARHRIEAEERLRTTWKTGTGAAIEALVEARSQAVPREPTAEMIEAGGLAINDDRDVLAVTGQEAKQAWKAMYDAAPSRPQAEGWQGVEEIAKLIALAGLGTINGEPRAKPNENWTQEEWERRVLECVPAAVEERCRALAQTLIERLTAKQNKLVAYLEDDLRQHTVDPLRQEVIEALLSQLREGAKP